MNSLVPEHVQKETLKRIYPHVTFKLDQDMDAYSGLDLLENKQNEMNFDEHPFLINTLRQQGKIRKKIIDDYVRGYYKVHKNDLENSRQTFQFEWEKVEPEFFEITNIIFNNHEWPTGEYICFPSIFKNSPRFLETKSFQAYINNMAGKLNAVAHEMLHFIFYDYLEKRHPDYVKQIGDDKLWALSEVFDEIAFEQPEYTTFKPKQPSLYPELQSVTTTLREKLKGKPFNIESFVEASKSI
jgi:hypothetical protein